MTFWVRLIYVLGLSISATCIYAGLQVTSLGMLKEPLFEEAENLGGACKWEAVKVLLDKDAERVVVKQPACDLGGNTSVRNRLPLVWKDKGYFRRSRDLGQVFTAPEDFTLEAIVLRTGNDSLAFLSGAAGAEVFVQFFEVEGEPVIDDNGTPPGTDATHGFSTNHRCDDFIRGVAYKSISVVEGGCLPDLTACGDGKLTYMKWNLEGEDTLAFKKGKRYAFMVGFVEPAPERNFTLGNRNRADMPDPPVLGDRWDKYSGGWGLRREGNGVVPPRRIPGTEPPADPGIRRQFEEESTFPEGNARFAIPPTCDGYPDVDTYRDHEYYLIKKS